MIYILDRWHPTSRGKVKCSFCRTSIPTGEKYERQKLVEDGQIWEWKTCQACDEVVAIAAEDIPEDFYTQEDIYLWAECEEEINGSPKQEIAKSFLHRFRTGERQ